MIPALTKEAQAFLNMGYMVTFQSWRDVSDYFQEFSRARHAMSKEKGTRTWEGRVVSVRIDLLQHRALRQIPLLPCLNLSCHVCTVSARLENTSCLVKGVLGDPISMQGIIMGCETVETTGQDLVLVVP